MKKIIFSGVNKSYSEIEHAMADGVGIFTAESIMHLEDINRCSGTFEKNVPVLVRLSAGSQFGMDEETVEAIIREREKFSNITIVGLHYFSGTQKKKAVLIEKELNYIDNFCKKLFSEYGFRTEKIEYGTGLAADYFGADSERTDEALLGETAVHIRKMAEKYSLTIEMGRFFAATCGVHFTKVIDAKCNFGINYAVCDSGVNQLHYDGQLQGMQIPKLKVFCPSNEKEDFWTLCGSLCTTADVLARKAPLKGLGKGSVIAFYRTGAYSVTEGMSVFLSRLMPRIVLYSAENGAELVRDFISTDKFNTSVKL